MGLLDLLSKKKLQPAECVVKLDNEEIDDMYPALVEVTVEADRSRATTATLVFEARRLEDGLWTVQDDDRFKPWVPVRIEAVFGDEAEEVMRGYIKEVRAEYPPERGGAKVTVSCQDHSLQLDREHVEQRWGQDAPTTDGAIATEIAIRNDLGILGEIGEGQTVQDVLQNTTDIKFLQRRAQANGYEIIFQEGMLHFGEMRLDAETQPTIMVYAGPDTNCISFNIQDDGHKPDSVAYQVAAEVGAEEPATEVTPNLRRLGNEWADSTGAGLNDFIWRPQRQGVSDATQMEAIAQRMANEQSMKINVDGELDGSLYGHVLRIGEPVGVDGVGERYSGTYYVDSATHRFDINGYKVSFRLLRNAYGDDLGESDNPLAGVV
ncbi:phage late control D family protein [Nitrosomonas marina]|uniref:Phage protein D n=1 Tax=Nitrosomonas marina TaxID=917 RepID=A0A1H8ANK2_9PROT|nr:phage late control D family protein [Nitrosomonas marina]SEM71564.1 Phage protein D [Nitrosomonas marina]